MNSRDQAFVARAHRTASMLIHAVSECNGSPIPVFFDKPRSCTNGRAIHISACPKKDPDYPILMLGFGIHEASHIRDTDFRCGRGWVKFAFKILNAFEDVRIEGRTIALLPGARDVLNDVVRYCWRVGLFSPVPALAAQSLGQAVLGYILYQARSLLLQPNMEEEAGSGRGFLRFHLPDDVIDHIDSCTHQIPGCESTADVAKLAWSVFEKVKSHADQAGVDLFEGEFQPTDLGEIIGDAMNEKSAVAAGRADGTIQLADVHDSGQGINGGRSQQALSLDKGFAARCVDNNAARALRRLFAKQRQEDTERASSGRKISTRHLARMHMGERYLFQRRHEGRVEHAAVALVGDASASMRDDNRCDYLCDALWTLATGVEKINQVVLSCYYFSNDVVCIKRFNDSLSVAKPYFRPQHKGGTATGTALCRVLADLSCVSAEHKIAILITDGLHCDHRKFEGAIRAFRLLGITLITIGVSCDLPNTYPNATKISNPMGIGQALSEALVKTLRGR